MMVPALPRPALARRRMDILRIARCRLLVFGPVVAAVLLGVCPRPAHADGALDFGGADAYVDFGNPSTLRLTQFTIELWMRRDGPGIGTNTGGGGVTDAIPLVSKGRSEDETPLVDINYLFGIRASTGHLVADFEEGSGGHAPSQNHPVEGVTPIVTGAWHHVAATYDGTTWHLYLDGSLEATLTVGEPPAASSTITVALGSALRSSGVAAGFFDGAMDEVRIWNYARSGAQIAAAAGQQITAATTGLVARWALDEGAGTTVHASAGTTVDGTIRGNAWSWGGGAPFDPDPPPPPPPPPPAGGQALDLGGVDAYVTFGNPSQLRLAQFTIELWMRRDGPGAGTNTGGGGVTDAIPLVSKGRSEDETPEHDINYLFGIRASTGHLVADFEEGPGGHTPSDNHPVEGVTPIGTGAWHHVAATYDGATWRLYLDGVLEVAKWVGEPPAASSTIPVALGSALRSTGVAAGFFDGAMDEVRIWDHARSGAEIAAAANQEMADPAAGLVARWALDEGSGTAVHGGAGTTLDGAVVGGAWQWTSGAPFDLAAGGPPAAPALVGPADGATGVALAAPLAVQVDDPDGGNLTVTFHGRPANGGAQDFTLIGLPDTQYYVSLLNGGLPQIFDAQVQWIVDQRAARNIVYVVHLGDCVEHGDTAPIEWQRADASMRLLENPATTGLPEGIPFGVCVGNHDQTPTGNADGTTSLYNQYFGVPRFSGRTYYGGHYGAGNDNWYDVFRAAGMDFIVVSLEFDETPDTAVLAWADQVLDTHRSHRAIVATHWVIGPGNPGAFGAMGQAAYDALKHHDALFLMLGAHKSGEGRRQDTYHGRTVTSLLADYQSRSNGGDGWLRIMEFSPANDVIRVRTYSPWLDQYEADADSSSQFTIPYDMDAGAPGPFQQLAVVTAPSDGQAATTWSGLAPGTEYEWYATVDDGAATVTSPTWRFTTGAGGTSPAITVLSPNGGEALAVGSTVQLVWDTATSGSVAAVDLELSRNGPGGPFEEIARDVPNTGSHAWLVTGPGCSAAYLRLHAADGSGYSCEDLSDGPFSVLETADVADGAGVLSLAPVMPNPARGSARFAFVLPREDRVRAEVIDIQGRIVANVADGVFPAGASTIAWHGAGAGGRSPSGVYFIRLRAAERTLLRRFVFVH